MRRGAFVFGVALVLAASAVGVRPPSAVAVVAACTTTPVLQGGTVSPSSGTTATTFTFSVQYSDASNCGPSSATVTVAGATSATLTPGSTAFSAGVTLSAALRLPAGSWSYSFTTTTKAKGGVQTVTFTAVSPARVTVAAIPPSPTPAPKPTPTPAPKPTATPTPSLTPTPSPSASPTDSPSPSDSPSDSTSPGDSIVSVVPGAGGSTGPQPASGSTSSGGPGPALLILLLVCALAGGLGLVVARRRRQPGDVPPPAPATAAVAPVVPETPPSEVPLARWRRPSVQAERASLDAALITGRGPARFAVPAQPGEDRRVVAFRLVRVGSDRDELRGEELTRLDRGDEVRVLEIDRDAARIETPDGTVGWIAVATLGGP